MKSSIRLVFPSSTRYFFIIFIFREINIFLYLRKFAKALNLAKERRKSAHFKKYPIIWNVQTSRVQRVKHEIQISIHGWLNPAN